MADYTVDYIGKKQSLEPICAATWWQNLDVGFTVAEFFGDQQLVQSFLL